MNKTNNEIIIYKVKTGWMLILDINNALRSNKVAKISKFTLISSVRMKSDYCELLFANKIFHIKCLLIFFFKETIGYSLVYFIIGIC